MVCFLKPYYGTAHKVQIFSTIFEIRENCPCCIFDSFSYQAVWEFKIAFSFFPKHIFNQFISTGQKMRSFDSELFQQSRAFFAC
jgi:hypothetical protein